MQIICKVKKLYEISKIAREIINNFEYSQDIYLELILNEEKTFVEKIDSAEYKILLKNIIKNILSSHLQMILYSRDASSLFEFSFERLCDRASLGEDIKFDFCFKVERHNVEKLLDVDDCDNLLQHSELKFEAKNFTISKNLLYKLMDNIKKEIKQKYNSRENLLYIMDIIRQEIVKYERNGNYVYFPLEMTYLFDIYIAIQSLVNKSLKIVFKAKNFYRHGENIMETIYSYSILENIIALYIEEKSLLGLFSHVFDRLRLYDKKHIVFEINNPKTEQTKLQKNKSIGHKIIFDILVNKVSEVIDFVQERAYDDGYFTIKKINDGKRKLVALYMPDGAHNGELLFEIERIDLGGCYYAKAKLLDLKYLDKKYIIELINKKLFAEVVRMVGLNRNNISTIKRFIEIDFLRML